MKANKARLLYDTDGTWISFLVGRQDALETLESIKDGKTYSITVKEHRERRSLDANAYCWVLIDRIAEKLSVPKKDIYRSFIREIGGNSETVCVMEKAADKLCEGWEHNGLGWQTERFPSKIDGCVNVILYYGSSTYDTKQMSRLIDMLVYECKDRGIETLTPMELDRLKDRWGHETAD